MSEGRLMIVEDDTDISNMLRIYFQSQDYDVAVAQRGEDALELCRQQLPHLIVLDIMLPDMDGYDVCRHLRGSLRTSHIPIIFLTQKDERSDKIHGLELGADDYITKPFDLEELKLRVKNAMVSAQYKSLTNATTGLPSGRLIEEQLRQLMRRDDWGIIYIGVKGLSDFKDEYGFVAAEEVLRFVAMILGRSVDQEGSPNDFIGHIGGDDFWIVSEKGLVGAIGEDLAQRFDAEIGTHYDWKARQEGNLMTLSLGTVTVDDGPFYDIREITEAASNARRGE
ncbi:MAG: response regulator [Chloroflexi bacterium]|nr:response regulator [Chloroflexota bacterium]